MEFLTPCCLKRTVVDNERNHILRSDHGEDGRTDAPLRNHATEECIDALIHEHAKPMLPKVSSTLELQALGWSFVYSAGGMGNGEFQVYDDTNCHPLRDGGVYIQATITQGCLVDKGITLRKCPSQGMYTNDDHWRRPGSCIIYDDSQRQCEVGGRVLQPFTSQFSQHLLRAYQHPV
jgi:hypothetical protein